jgi:UDP-glucose 4-epimerase
MLFAFEHAGRGFEVYNLGTESQTTVREIAEIVARAMGLEGVKLRFTGGVKGGRGWVGDVKVMLLDISRIKKLGWHPKCTSREAVEEAARALLSETLLTSSRER